MRFGWLTRRGLGVGAVLLAATPPFYEAAAQERFPDRPVKAIIAFSAGGGSDRELRMLQPALEKTLGVPVAIENRPGAGTQIANTLVQRAPADGYTLLYTNWDSLVLTAVLGNAEYTMEDFEPLAIQLIDPTIILVAKESPYNSLNDFIQAVREKPGKLAVGATSGSIQHLLVLALRERLKLDLRVVGYPGGGPARAAMLGGHVDAAMGEVQGAFYLREQAKVIGIFANRVYSQWPEGKPVNEQLKPHGVEIANLSRYGVYMVRSDLKKTYPGRFARLQAALLEAGRDPGYLEMAKKAGIDGLLVWAPGERYVGDFKAQQEFFEKTKDLWAKKD